MDGRPYNPDGPMENNSLTLFGVAIAAYFVSMPLYFAAAGWGKIRIARVAMALTAVGVVAHLGSYGFPWAADGHYPLSNMYEYTSQLALLMFLFFLPPASFPNTHSLGPMAPI